MSGDSLAGLEIRNHTDTKAYKDIRISSKDRLSGEPYNFNINLGNASDLDRVVEIHLISASIPNICYNISSANGNNIFSFTGTISGVQQIVIDDGFYTTSQIMTILKNEIDLVIAPSTITIEQSEFTKKITFTVIGADTLLYPNTGLNKTIGILNQIGPLGTATAQGLPALNGSTMFYIHSQDISPNKTYLNSNNGIRDVNGGFTIPIDVPFGFYQEYHPTDLDRQVYGRFGKSLKNFAITLRTNGGRLVTELTDNFEMVLTIRFYWHTE